MLRLLEHEINDVQRAVREYDRALDLADTPRPAVRTLVERIGEIYDVARARQLRDSADAA